MAFPGSAIRLLASAGLRFQSRRSFGRFEVARMRLVARRAPRLRQVRFGKSAFRQRGFPEPAAVGAHCCSSPVGYCGREWFLLAFRLALVSSLRVVSFGQSAQLRGRAPIRAASKLRRVPIFTASVFKSVPGFMGAGLTRRCTGRRVGTAASTEPCWPGAGELSR
jgi:hypothetical protein